MESPITINTAGLRLEGRLNPASKTRAAVIMHPHPLYGGDMNNGVVTSAAHAYNKGGWTTLRFNFRGTGLSQGEFDDGIGEQDDLQGAIDHLLVMGFKTIDLVGYSFGAAVTSMYADRHVDHPHRVVLIAPPVAFMKMPTDTAPTGLLLVITGSHDTIAPPHMISGLLAKWRMSDRLVVLQDADHSYFGALDQLKDAISSAI